MDKTNAERQKRYRERQKSNAGELKALREAHDVTKSGGGVTEVGQSVTELVESVTPVTVAWDKEKFPERKAWEVAVVRVERAKRYAKMFPKFIRGDDIKFQMVEWQYENEGLPAVSKLVSGNPS